MTDARDLAAALGVPSEWLARSWAATRRGVLGRPKNPAKSENTLAKSAQSAR